MTSFLDKLRWIRSSRNETVQAQARLLSLGGVEDKVEAVDTTIEWTDWRGRTSHEVIHSLEGGHEGPLLIYFPGYAAASGFIFRNLGQWIGNFSVKAVDFLGTGLSSRPAFHARSTREAEDFFIESFELWRRKRQIEKFTLVGHSMGGYLAATYALRHPQCVEHLVLVCPAGVGRRPDDWETKIPAALKNPFTIRGVLFRAAQSFWDWGFTPGGLIRAMGPLGKKVVLGYTQRRFITGDHLSEEEVAAFSEYMYGITASKGSGEYALRHILMPFAFARSPLETRLAELTVPVSFIYGETDWMDRQAGHRAIEGIKARRSALNDGDCKLVEIRNAGHYCQIEQKDVFFQEMLRCLGLDSSAVVAEEEAGEAIETADQLEEEWNSAPLSAATHVVEGL